MGKGLRAIFETGVKIRVNLHISIIVGTSCLLIRSKYNNK